MDTVQQLENLIKDKNITEALKILAGKYPDEVVFSTSFGQEDQVLSDIILSNKIRIKIFTLDTGRLFQETYDVLESMKIRYKEVIHIYHPDSSAVEKLMTEKGPNSFYYSIENRKECCGIRKIEPLKRALKGNKIWITGLRAEQSEHRSGMPILEWDNGNQIIKYHPLIHWSLEEVTKYLKENHVPYNILHDKGYPSIGCQPCTRAIQPGEDIRAGRWWWENSKKECGLHKLL